jgi:AAHS family 4-hydroxybenzoate transporter-like MFS transporter
MTPSAKVTGDGRIDIAQVIDAARFGGLSFWVTALSFIIMTVDGYDLQSVAFAAPALAAEWNVKRELLGPVLAASIAGMGVGSILLGWLGDRIGRKSSLCLCIAVLSLGSFASAHAASLNLLVLFRFITGIGLGGATPLATALIAEWTPARWRNVAVAAVVVGVPLGGSLGAVVASWIIPAYGWRSVFLVGAVLPLVLLVAASLRLPESPKYLVRRPQQRARLASSLNRLVGEQRFTGSEDFVVRELETPPGSALTTLVRPPYLGTTLLIWAAFACNTLSLYSFVNWLPTVLSSVHGMSMQSALHGSAVFNFGGIVGALVGSALISRYGSRLVGLAIALAGVGASILIGMTLMSPGQAAAAGTGLLLLVAVAGVCMNGMQVFLYAVSAHSYPTHIRGSGVGCASAMARAGGVLSSVVGSAFFALGLSSAEFFYILAATIALTAVSFASLRSHIPGTHRGVAGARVPAGH